MPDTLGSTAALVDSTGAHRHLGVPAVRGHRREDRHQPDALHLRGIWGYFKDVLDRLLRVRARLYRPNVPRWLTVDPLWPGQSGYGYVGGRPVGLVGSARITPDSTSVSRGAGELRLHQARGLCGNLPSRLSRGIY